MLKEKHTIGDEERIRDEFIGWIWASAIALSKAASAFDKKSSPVYFYWKEFVSSWAIV